MERVTKRRDAPPVAEIALSQREFIRKQYQPARVSFLFVGESPPASGRFFYTRNSGLYRAFLECFQTLLPDVTDADFLETFQSLGCYLVDLCLVPVDQLTTTERQQLRRESESLLHQSIRELKPQRIASVMRAIQPNVKRAADQAGWQGTILDLPYPGRWSRHRSQFIEILKPQLTDLLQNRRA